MKRAALGYTILEVLMFLAITSLLLVAAIASINGQQERTEFSTAVRDVDNKFQSWIADVANGLSGGNAVCTLGGGGYPQLSATSTDVRGTNPVCTYLGKVIQVTAQDEGPSGSQDANAIYAYTVIGIRSQGTQLVSNIVDAKPIAGVFGGVDLTTVYHPPYGLRVKWVKSSSVVPNSHLAGIFTSFNTEATVVTNNAKANGSQYVMSVQYPFRTNDDKITDANSGLTASCIKMLPGCKPPANQYDQPFPMKDWTICFESVARSNETASITIVSSNGRGASTKVSFPCS